jgi:hypothetical protein
MEEGDIPLLTLGQETAKPELRNGGGQTKRGQLELQIQTYRISKQNLYRPEYP